MSDEEQLQAALVEQERLRGHIMQYVDRAAHTRDSVVRMRRKLQEQRARIVELELLLASRDQELRDHALEAAAYLRGFKDAVRHRDSTLD